MMKLFFLLLLLFPVAAMAQKGADPAPVYVDKQGVMRWKRGNGEVALFGVNYTVPFAYGYRSHKALGIDPEKAIDADVYHMQRLGLNAFRVHVWDVELSDSAGNLLENEHLRLFDYLLKKLKERNIAVMLTPIAFWGNGYPQPDEKTPGFSTVYGKRGAVVHEAAIRAQERYLVQLLNHVNPYTGLSYKNDPSIIAVEINNEPQHSGTKLHVTGYVNRMVAAVKSTGCRKPVFYNISESPAYADAVAASKAEGFSFQWYPTGLVANRELQGNFLPHVDQYRIPFRDTIKAFARRALMVYEFDAGDVMQPVMYPSMSRSFRAAGFQWATQFAYDPMYTAFHNSEYQTHYLNLAYTPAKAISLLIAARVFRDLPRGKSFGTYPLDTAFQSFRISPYLASSEMNSPSEYYHTGSTATLPVQAAKLEHIAGVGYSPLVHYEGTGAYFLDRLAPGRWRLEVMPDVVPIRDPFGKAAPSREVGRIYWKEHPMQLWIPDLGGSFTIKGGKRERTNVNGSFLIAPGVYELGKSDMIGTMNFDSSFYAPPPYTGIPFIAHEPPTQWIEGTPMIITATVAGADTADRLLAELQHSSNTWKTITLQREGYHFTAPLPEEMRMPGIVSYRLLLRRKTGESLTFPGNITGDPYAWDAIGGGQYETHILPAGSPVYLFHPQSDRKHLMPFIPEWTKQKISYRMNNEGQLVQNLSALEDSTGWQLYVGEKVKQRQTTMNQSKEIVIRLRGKGSHTANCTLINDKGQGFAASIPVADTFKEIRMPLDGFKPAAYILLPRPYPRFQHMMFRSPLQTPLELASLESIQFISGAGEVEIEWIRLQ